MANSQVPLVSDTRAGPIGHRKKKKLGTCLLGLSMCWAELLLVDWGNGELCQAGEKRKGTKESTLRLALGQL